MAARILIIDDEPDVTTTLKEYFQQHHLEVLIASTGEEGLQLLASEQPALVLLDMRLGHGISGMEVLRRGKKAKTDAQIIVITAVDDRNVAEMAKGFGAAGYITKPFAIEELERVVLSRLKK